MMDAGGSVIVRETEFREWMADEGQAPATQNTITMDARRLETYYGDLDEAFDTDGFEAIRQALAYSKADERADRPNPARFPIEGDLYANLSHYRSTLNAYARFRSAADTASTGAEDIDKRIELFDDQGNAHWPVRQRDRAAEDIAFRIRGASNRTIDAEKTTDILEVGRALFKEGKSVRVVRSNNLRRPYLSYGKQKLTSYKMAPEIAAALGMPPQGSVNDAAPLLDPTVLKEFKERFLAAFPDFEPSGFAATSGGYFDAERRYKDALIEKAEQALDDESLSDEALGRRLLDLLISRDSGLLGWRTDGKVRQLRDAYPGKLEVEAGRLVRSEEDPATAVGAFVEAVWPILSEGQDKNQPYSESRNIPSMLLAFAYPTEAIGINTDPLWRVSKALTGKSLLGNNPLTEDEYAEVLDLADTLFEKFEEWGWQPRDLWDVQGFIWVVREGQDPVQPIDLSDNQEKQTMPKPTNLILYAPPGTGKTYSTVQEAVALCHGSAPEDRGEIKARYDTLVEAGQIGFVTFHQSYAYEDFVEGLRPETGSRDGEEEAASGGFRLEPKRGIFREIAALAQQARRNAGKPTGLDLTGREFFKMSLGRAGSEDHIYDAAIEGDYIVLGWGGDVDWSDPKYNDYQAIFDKWNELQPGTHGSDGNISQLWRFRSSMKEGDIVIVPDGNSSFRAIGEIVGPYEYASTDVREYNHRRKIRWLLVLEESLPVETIHDGKFTMRTCYLLKRNRVKLEALSRLLPGNAPAADATPDQFVLIIDEINRANISKVFGELITLIEEDKRIGGDNQTTVKLPYSGDVFGVPDNLHIIGTMNTADRSIALLDTALRRRFTFRELMPEPELLQAAAERTGAPLVSLLRRLNERIEYLFDREHQIGHAYFISCETIEDVHETMRHRVIPLLAEYFYEDWHKVALVLGDAEGAGRFLTRTQLAPPAGIQSDGFSEDRWRWKVRDHFDDNAYDAF
jgi:5-methylcytosine-specific restriction protein B